MKKSVIFVGALAIASSAYAELVSKTLPPEAEIASHCAAVYGALLGDPSSNPVQQAYYFAKSKVMVDQAVLEAEGRGISREEARKFTQNLLKQIQDTAKINNSMYQTMIKQELETCEFFDVYRKTHQR